MRLAPLFLAALCSTQHACAPVAWSLGATATVSTPTVEVCDGRDNDGDGQVDEGVVQLAWRDLDGDGFGDASQPVEGCIGGGLVSNADDCDDTDATDATVHPGAAEVCNGRDDDCDTQVDDHAGRPWFTDHDGDGHGDATQLVVACVAPVGTVSSDADCDDTDPDVHPGATEVCDGHDNDGDGATDDDDLDVVDQSTWYADRDGDGWGDPDRSTARCAAPDHFVSHIAPAGALISAVAP